MDTAIHRLRCACGWEASGTLDELVIAAGEHGRRVHNMTPTRDEVLAMVISEPSDASAHRAQPGGAADSHT
jgi:predicted small metal-binding protein